MNNKLLAFNEAVSNAYVVWRRKLHENHDWWLSIWMNAVLA